MWLSYLIILDPIAVASFLLVPFYPKSQKTQAGAEEFGCDHNPYYGSEDFSLVKLPTR